MRKNVKDDVDFRCCEDENISLHTNNNNEDAFNCIWIVNVIPSPQMYRVRDSIWDEMTQVLNQN